MHFNLITRDIFLNFVSNLFVVFILLQFDFTISSEHFTVLLAIALLCISVLTGFSSSRNQGNGIVNGFFVGLLSAVFTFLFLGQYVPLRLDVFFIISCIWGTFGALGGLIGSKITASSNTPT